KKWLAASEQKTYFVTNSRYLIAPVLLTVVIAVAYLLAIGKPQFVAAIFVSFWLTVWTIAVSAMLVNVYKTWRTALQTRPSAVAGAPTIGKALSLSFFPIPFVLFEGVGLWFLMKTSSLSFVVFILASGLLHGLFYHLMKAPTLA